MSLAYLFVYGVIRDPERWGRSRHVLDRLAEVFGARLLARTGQVEFVQGALDGDRVALIEFPSLRALRLLIQSPEYADLDAMRKDAGEITLWAFPGLPDARSGPAAGERSPPHAPPPPSRPPASPPRAYLIVRTELPDRERSKRYPRIMTRLGESFGALYLARTDQVEALQGAYPGGRLSLFEFPSTQSLRLLLDSPEYAELNSLRKDSGLRDIWAVPGV